MDPVTMSLLATAAAGGISAYGQYRANQQNIHEAEKNRHWQEMMSNSAYQRSMKDMQLAGINPIMASKLGGASTPGGAQATVNDVISPAVQAALTVKRVEAEINNLQAQAQNTDARTAQTQLQNQKLKLTTLPYEVGNTAIDVIRKKAPTISQQLQQRWKDTTSESMSGMNQRLARQAIKKHFGR